MEPSGAAALAALASGRIPFRSDRPVVVVLSGGNAEEADIRALMARYGIEVPATRVRSASDGS